METPVHCRHCGEDTGYDRAYLRVLSEHEQEKLLCPWCSRFVFPRSTFHIMGGTFSSFNWNAADREITKEDAKILSGKPEPLKILVPVEIEE